MKCPKCGADLPENSSFCFVCGSKVSPNAVSPRMNPIEAVQICFKKFANFSGCASRREFWWFYLFYGITLTVCELLDMIWGVPVLSLLTTGAFAIPVLAVGIRRMHDIGKHGAFILIPVYSLILACMPTKEEDNLFKQSE